MAELESGRADLEDRGDTINFSLRHFLGHAEDLEGNLIFESLLALCRAHRSLLSLLLPQAANLIASTLGREQDEPDLVGEFVLHDHGRTLVTDVDETHEDIVTIDRHLLDVPVLQTDDQLVIIISVDEFGLALLRRLLIIIIFGA